MAGSQTSTTTVMVSILHYIEPISVHYLPIPALMSILLIMQLQSSCSLLQKPQIQKALKFEVLAKCEQLFYN